MANDNVMKECEKLNVDIWLSDARYHSEMNEMQVEALMIFRNE